MYKEDMEIATVIFLSLIVFGMIGFILGMGYNRSKVGGDEVPHGLHCQEDEVIGYDPLDMNGPRPLTCVHIDNFVEAAR